MYCTTLVVLVQNLNTREVTPLPCLCAMHSPPSGKPGRPPGRKHRKVAREEQDAILLGARRRPRGARRLPSWRGGAYILRLGVLPSVCDRGGAGLVLWAVMWSHRDASRFALYGDRPALREKRDALSTWPPQGAPVGPQRRRVGGNKSYWH